MTRTIPAFAILALVAAAPLAAQKELSPPDPLEEYGVIGLEGELEYSGDELVTPDGKVVLYQLTDSYDGYTAMPGANATFVQMANGNTRTVVPQDGDTLLLNLDIIYTDDEEELAVGYVARTGTQAQYSEGRINLVVGRLADLEQQLVFENIRFADMPTFVLDNSVAMVVWPENDEAQYLVVDLATFEVGKVKMLDLPKPVELKRPDCECAKK